MMKKYNKLKSKKAFLLKLNEVFGGTEKSKMSTWFNRKTGFKIPCDKEEKVDRILDLQLQLDIELEETKKQFWTKHKIS